MCSRDERIEALSPGTASILAAIDVGVSGDAPEASTSMAYRSIVARGRVRHPDIERSVGHAARSVEDRSVASTVPPLSSVNDPSTPKPWT